MKTQLSGFSRRDALRLIPAGVALAPTAVSQKVPDPAEFQYSLGIGSPTAQMELNAGPLTMVFEPELAFIRYLKFGNREILRGLYAAVRDRNWGTVPPRISNLKLERTADEFQLTFDVDCKQADIDYGWKGLIAGNRDGTVRFDFDGTSRSAFLRNRIGFCILHPIDECAGQPAVVEKADGSKEQGRFPAGISPHQPFMDMRAITHTVVPGLQAEVRFDGDIFEMEDQRNWTDGSYKTYCTPLARPFPAEVKPGDRVKQSVTVTLKGKGEAPAVISRRTPIILTDRGGANRLPALGLGLSSVTPDLTAQETERLRALGLSHLRVDLDLAGSNYAAALKRAAAQASATGARLEIAVFLGADPQKELQSFVDSLRAIKPPAKHYLVFHKNEKSTRAATMQLARKAIIAFDPAARLSSGTNAYFTELNRERPPVADSHAVAYSINPQVHAFDNLSLVETLEIQAATLASAREFCGSLPLIVTPVTLRPRFNPNATGAVKGGASEELPFEVDARQPSLFTAAWTVGSLKYLAEGGAASATFYETVGWRGLMEAANGSPVPAKFKTKPGAIFPVYHVLADVLQFAEAEVTRIQSSNKLELEGLLLRKNNAYRMMIANLTPEPRVVRVHVNFGTKAVRLKMLDQHTAGTYDSRTPGKRLEADTTLQLALLPYAVARVDSAA